MDNKELLFADLRKQGIRITKQRRAIIDTLEGKHLTINEIYDDLRLKGYHNLGTVYNNIDFLLEHEIVTTIFINGKKHFDLTLSKDKHDAKSHIHVTCQTSGKITEINDQSIFEYIKSHRLFKYFNIEKIQLVIDGHCAFQDAESCRKEGGCFLKSTIKNNYRR
jgi:Fe2+ or Zn2+ uptake regulation protein